MNAILIKPRNKAMYSIFLELIKATHAPAKILTKREEDDELFVNAIEERMKSPHSVSKDEIRKLFRRYGIRI